MGGGGVPGDLRCPTRPLARPARPAPPARPRQDLLTCLSEYSSGEATGAMVIPFEKLEFVCGPGGAWAELGSGSFGTVGRRAGAPFLTTAALQSAGRPGSRHSGKPCVALWEGGRRGAHTACRKQRPQLEDALNAALAMTLYPSLR